MELRRKKFSSGGLGLSYLDSGKATNVLVALHGHWMEAATFVPIAGCLPPGWRLVALDQRGHGQSDHGTSYERADYLADIEALFEHLAIPSAVLLGHSLGGVNAYQFAARHPERVRAMIVEDIGATVSGDVDFIQSWAGVFPTKQALEERIGARLAPYVRDSFRETRAGWQLSFDPLNEQISQEKLNGDHWSDWLASCCDVLLIRGDKSPITDPAEMQKMAETRPQTTLVTLQGGHVVHMDDRSHFCEQLAAFLGKAPAAPADG